jgi:ethanolamine permease
MQADGANSAAPADSGPGLRQGAIGWVLLTALGISYVIAGDYSGWNFGLAHGGWGGMLIAVVFGCAMYTALLATLAELATLIPEAGAGAAFAERAFGPIAGCLAGGCIWIEYVAAAAVIAVFLEAYLRALTGIGGPGVVIGVFVLFVAIHSAGVGEALRVLLAMALVALFGLVVFVVATAPYVATAHLFEETVAPGTSRWLPFGWTGVWAALPFGTAFFLAVEGIALAAEETRDPARNLPRGMTAAMLILTAFAALLLITGPGAAGVLRLKDVSDPLVVALEVVHPAGRAHWVVSLVNLCGLAGFLACLFSAIFGYSRLTFALSRAHYLPAWLSRTNRRQVPVLAVIVPGAIGCALALTGAAEQIFVLMVSAGTLSYLLIVPAHWVMRARGLAGGYRTPGGIATSAFAWLASLLSFTACFVANPRWSSVTLGVLALFLGAYFFRRRSARPQSG